MTTNVSKPNKTILRVVFVTAAVILLCGTFCGVVAAAEVWVDKSNLTIGESTTLHISDASAYIYVTYPSCLTGPSPIYPEGKGEVAVSIGAISAGSGVIKANIDDAFIVQTAEITVIDASSTLTVETDGHGTVTGVPPESKVHPGTKIQLTAVPESSHFRFDHWEVTKGKEEITLSGNPATFTMPKTDVSVKAVFAADASPVASVTKDGTEYTFASVEEAVQFCDKEMSEAVIVMLRTSDEAATITLPENGSCKDLTLNLNGSSLRNSGSGPVISVENGRKLNVTSSKGGNITGGNNTGGNGGGIYVDQGGEFNLSGGNITGNKATNGGGVYVHKGGKFTMTGGSVSGNTAVNEQTERGNGGGVYNSGDFILSNGSISNNKAEYGAGVFVATDCTFTMSGGKISGNTASYDGGGVCVMKGGTFEMTDGSSSIISGNTANNGGGVCNTGTFNMKGGVISGNTAGNNGGGVYNNNSAAPSSIFTMSAGTIEKNKADTGGGVFNGGTSNEKCTFAMQGGSITENTATKDGGGVCNHGAFTMSDGTIEENTAKNGTGGGVYIYETGTFTMSGGEATIIRNSASNGGGVYNKGTVEMSGGNIIGNTATEDGGGVYTQGTFRITDDMAKIEGNISSTDGGGVYVDENSSFSMNGGSITGNTANEDGGGVYNSGSFTMSAGKITNNTVIGNGGGLYNKGTFNVRDSPIITDNLKKTEQNETTANNAYFEEKTLVSIIAQLIQNSTEKVNAKIGVVSPVSENTPFANAGIPEGGQQYVIKETDANCFFADGVVDLKASVDTVSNQLKWVYSPHNLIAYNSFTFDKETIISSPDSPFNGCTYGFPQTRTLTLTKDIILESPITILSEWKDMPFTINLNGHVLGLKDDLLQPVILIPENSELVIEDNLISENDSVSHWFKYSNLNGSWELCKDTPSPAAADKTYNSLGEFNRTEADSYVSGGNTVYIKVTGGCIYGKTLSKGQTCVENSGTFILKGGNIVGNSTTYGDSVSKNGGGVYNEGTFEMSGGNIIGNSATLSGESGGGVYNRGIFRMSGGNISGNNAEIGGGVYNAGTFEMSGGNIAGNSAKNGGGGVYNEAMFRITGDNVVIEENYSVMNGGGVYNTGRFEMSGGNIAGNDGKNEWYIKNNMCGTDCFGGGIYNSESGEFVMDGGYILSNKSKKDSWEKSYTNLGGGVYAAGTFTMSNGVISENEAKEGGGVYAVGTFTMSDGIISKNTAKTGGGVYFSGSSFLMSGGTIGGTADTDKNTAENGGGVYISSESQFTLSDGEISCNSATQNGGGIYLMGGFSMSAGKISANVANSGGGVYVEKGDTFTMSGGVIDENSAERGGGVFVDGVLSLSNSACISNNKANNSSGGGVYVGVDGTFTMDDNCSLDGNSADIDGGGLFINTGGAFTLNGGTIVGNNAGSNGGGMYSTTGGTFTMNAGSITNNSAGGTGGGVFADGTFNLSGTSFIIGNTAGSSAAVNNIYLGSGRKITINSELAKGSAVSITSGSETYPVSLTTEMASDYSAHFISDNPGQYRIQSSEMSGKYTVKLAENGGLPVEYTLTYNGNGNTGGEVPNVPIRSHKDVKVTVLGNTDNLAKTGYTFNGWNTQADGEGTTYQPGEMFIITENTILYAKWIKDTPTTTYTVSFDGNKPSEATGTVENIPAAITDVSPGSTISAPGTTPTLTGYTFGGWHKEKACTNAWNFTTDVVNADTTLYAKWTKDTPTTTYTVNFDGNKPSEATGTVENIPAAITDVSPGSTISAPGTNPTLTGYTFGGWHKEKACTNAWNFATDVVNADTTLYAKWTRLGTEIAFHDGTGRPKMLMKLGDILTLPQAPTKEGYTFLGWRVGSTTGDFFSFHHGTHNILLPDSLYYDTLGKWTYMGETLDLYAAWDGDAPTPTSYMVSAIPEGNGSIDGASGEITVGTPVTLTAIPADGSHFKKWVTAGLPAAVSTANPLNFSMPSKDVSVVAEFESGSPSSQDMTVRYQNDGASYVLNIPSTLTLNKSGVTSTSIGVSDVMVPEGQHIDVKLTTNDVESDKTQFFLKQGENRFHYTIGTNPDGSNHVSADTNVLGGVTEATTKGLYFKLTDTPSTAGTYTGTLTFTASVA